MALACAGEGLEQAQMNKLDDLIAQAGICATDHVLDIGFGWGSGAIRAVQTTGCRYDAGTSFFLLSILVPMAYGLASFQQPWLGL